MSSQQSLTGLKYPAMLCYTVIYPCTISSIGFIVTLVSLLPAEMLIGQSGLKFVLLDTLSLGIFLVGAAAIVTGLLIMVCRVIHAGFQR